MSSRARIERPSGNRFPQVVKADQFLTAYQRDSTASFNTVTGFFSGVSKALLAESPDVLAKMLVQMHRPIHFDFAAEFGFEVKPGRSVKALSAEPATPVLVES